MHQAAMAVGRAGDYRAMKILVILASGIGNSILFGPALRAIREKDSSWEIHAFAYLPAFASPFIYSDLVDRFIHYEGIATSLALRKEKYDVSICAFPSKRPIYNVLSYIVGAEKRITHSYRSGGVMSMNWLQNARVPADEALHDVEQNLNLLSRLGIEKPTAPQVFFSIPEESNKAAQDFLSGRGLVGRHLVGAHPGAGALSWKRAPISEFLKRIEQERTANSEIIIFGGAEERQEKEELRDALGERAQIFEGSLHDTAALIRRCNAFVTNDTGLMHIASTSSATRVVALFNGTNPRRTRPCTQNSEIVVLKETILKYPFSSMSPKGGGRLSIRRPRI
jgi:heptosyltransferase-2